MHDSAKSGSAKMVVWLVKDMNDELWVYDAEPVFNGEKFLPDPREDGGVNRKGIKINAQLTPFLKAPLDRCQKRKIQIEILSEAEYG